jgi:hypothetical protein
MWSRARVAALRSGLLLTACLLARGAADPGATGSWESLVLKGGRVLHRARILSDEGESVVIRCDEGLLKVAKSSLPAPFSDPARPEAPAAAQMVMQPFDPDLAPSVPEPQAKPKAKPKPAPEKAPPARSPRDPAFKGCTITGFTMKPFQNSLGCAQVEVENAADTAVVILPANFVCVTADGKRLPGRQIVTDGFPPIISRREVIPPHGSVEIEVTFSNDSLDAPSVEWAK